MENQNKTQEITFNPGDTFFINGRNVGGKTILKDRLFQYSKNSKSPGLVNGFLIHPKTGLPQKTEIAIPVELLEPLETLPKKEEEVV